MNLKDLIAKVTGLEARATEAFKAELAELRANVTGTIEQLKGELAAALQNVTNLTNEKSDLEARNSELTAKLSDANKEMLDFNALLADACLNGKLLDLKLAADATPEQMRTAALAVPMADKFKAYQGALNAGFAKANLPNSTLPKAPEAPIGQTGANTMTRAAAMKLSPAALLEFVNKGGKMID